MDQGLLNEAYATLYGVAESLMEDKWVDNVEAIRESIEDVEDITLASTAIMLENLDRFVGRMDEATRSTQIGGFIHHGFDLITAIMPSLIANQILSVQPQTRRIGEIFFLDFIYGSSKGAISSGTDMFSSLVAGNAQTEYTSEKVTAEVLFQGDGSTTDYSGSTLVAAWLPMRNDSANGFTITLNFVVGSAAQTAVAAADGDFSAHAEVTSGVIAEETGVITNLVFNTAPDAASDVSLTYWYNMEGDASTSPMIPEVDLKITSQAVEAHPRKMKARYTLDASYDLQMAFGKSAETELTTALASEIRQEIDGELIANVYAGAGASAPTQWDKTPPDSSISYNDHKWTFIDTVIAASNAIFTATRRAVGNFLIADIEVCNVIESLAPRFKREGRIQPGPHYLGTLDGNWKVYKDPFLSSKAWMTGYKGDLFLEAGYIYAPYLLLYTTPLVQLADFISQKGMASMYGQKMVNSNFYCSTTITET
jgi:hypothetical protein